MKSLRKQVHLTIRFSREQLAKIREAARRESQRRRELVEPGSLVRDLVMPRIEEVLTTEPTSAVPAA